MITSNHVIETRSWFRLVRVGNKQVTFTINTNELYRKLYESICYLHVRNKVAYQITWRERIIGSSSEGNSLMLLYV